MCVAISDQDVLDYIFASDTTRTFVSYEDMSGFRETFAEYILSKCSNNPHYASVYFEPLRDLSEERYLGSLDREADGIYLYGHILPEASHSIESRYADKTVSDALRTAYRSISQTVGV